VLAFGAAWAHVDGLLVEARSPAEIDALLSPYDEVFRPEGAGPFPAAILFHGCGGLRDSLREWARELRDAGLLVVATNSFAGRKLHWKDVCQGRTLLGSERAGDVWVSLARVRARDDVDPERILLLGWSHGAWSLMELFALEPGELPPNLDAPPAADYRDVAGLVLFYPYCGLAARARRSWPPGAPPTLMLLAGQDTIVSAEACGAWADGRPGVETHVYPGVDHGFDQRVVEPEWPSTYEERAALDARRRVLAFVREHAGLPSAPSP
jgi:dienelactone hydrolase